VQRRAIRMTTLNARGLSPEEAELRLAEVGPNVLPEPTTVPLWKRVASQFVHFFALMLWFAGVLAIIGGLLALGIAIFAVIIVNGLFAFAQEYRAERAAQRLRALLPQRVTVVRGGSRMSVDATQLVPDDLVVLAEGDRISADLSVLESHGLSVDTSTLTGESVPASVGPDDTVHAGTFVVEGEGLAQVVATGAQTELAHIAELTERTERPDTPLTRELHRLVRTVAIIAATTGAGFFGLTLLLGAPPSDGFIFAIGVTVALVPEGLLPTVTLSLAIGAQRMAEQHALVRRLEAVETLGSTTFICTDKTGTLTQNRMRVVEVWTPAGVARIGGEGYEPTGSVETDAPAVAAALPEVIGVARGCSNGRVVEDDDGTWHPQGDPMEAAIDVLARRLLAEQGAPRLPGTPSVRFPFDPRRRRVSVVADGRVLAKGATDSVIPVCSTGTDGAEEAAHELSARGLRVIAVASRTLEGRLPSNAAEAEAEMTLLGLLGLEDPPRPEAAAAIAACRTAGIKVAMITGDHPRTAQAVAGEVGLLTSGAPILVGRDLPASDEVLGALIDHDGAVIARVDPETKLRIARALRRRDHVVGMTGDGVNDGPALREADIGIAMGASGSDVAREAADLVLLDDNFATIVSAVRQGRTTFANARKFLTYHLTDNVAELTPFAVWALSGGRFPLALGVLQVLALDLGTDTASAAALGAEPAADRPMERRPASGRLLNRTVAARAFGLLGPVEATLEMGAFLVALLAAGWRPGDSFPSGQALAAASGAAFLTVVFAQTANAFACRSTRLPAWRMPWTSNRFLLFAVATELVFAFAMIAIPAAAGLLDQTWPPAWAWAVIIGSVPAMLLADSLWKRWRNRAAGAFGV
jgi:magnesium-transporting ATPase (P-type)